MVVATKRSYEPTEVTDDVEFTDISSTSLEELERITGAAEQGDFSQGSGEDSDPGDSVPSSSTAEGAEGCTERKQPKLIANKTCLVCGDAALGKNFGAVSCESCKAFFRRNALKNVFGRCEGRCDVSIENRSYCKRCRMTKCLAIGMRREMLITQQRKRRKPVKESSGSSTGDLVKKGFINLDALTPQAPSSLSIAKPSGNQGGNQGGNQSGNQGVARQSTSPERSPVPENVFDATGQFKSWESSRIYGLSVAVPECVLEHIPKQIREDITEMINAFDVSFDQCHVNPTLPQSPDSFEIHALMGISIKKLVKMGKHLRRFQGLKQEDQIMLLKGGVVEILVLRSVSNYHPGSGTWFVPKAPNAQQHNFVNAKGLSEGYDCETEDMFTSYNKFVENVQQLLKGDSIILMLLVIITLFSADRTIVKEKDKVDLCQEHYSRVLEIYCGHLYPSRPQLFAKSMVSLMDLRSIHEIQSQMLAKMPVEKLEPLIKEIFDV